jgi:hypothetical protein
VLFQGDEDMKIFEVEHSGTLKVAWVDCYQHPDNQTIATVHPGQYVALMTGAEFQRFKKDLL